MFNSQFKIVYFVGLIVATIIRKAYTSRYIREPATVRRKSPTDAILVGINGFAMLLPLIYVLTPWLDFADYSIPVWTGWVGTGIFAAFCLMLWRSHADLGRQWTPFLELRERHELVTNGVYGRVRHPMYAAHLLWAVAQPLMLQNWIAGPVFLVSFLPMYLYRVPREEQMMLEEFGEEYRAYMSVTGRMWPRLRLSSQAEIGS